MAAPDSSIGPPAAPPQFSLRTMFLAINCMAVAALAFRLAGNSQRGIPVAVAAPAAFLSIWFLVTGRFRYSAWALSASVVALLFFPAVNSAVTSGRQPQCSNNLKQIGLALLYYHQLHGSFPPAYVADANGKPLYSWRVLLLPQLDESPLAGDFQHDEPWDGPHNRKLSGILLNAFRCPSDPTNLATTDYVAVVGAQTAWPGARGRKLSEIADPSKTILLVEVADSGINWAEPRDLYIGQMAPGVNSKAGQGVSSHHLGLAHVLFADGHIEVLTDDVVPEKLAAMFDVRGTDAGKQ